MKLLPPLVSQNMTGNYALGLMFGEAVPAEFLRALLVLQGCSVATPLVVVPKSQYGIADC